MITAGCDIGSLTAKAVIVKDGEILSSDVVLGSANPEDSARKVMDAALHKAGINEKDVDFCVGTGYGRNHISFAGHTESEIMCHARGAVKQLPGVRTVVDIGGQDAKAIRTDDQGNVVRYVYNDKCASGTGRFLEIIAEALDIPLEELGNTAEKSRNRLTLSNQCVVFAETEIISLVNDGKEISDIIKALHYAVAGRAASLARSIELEGDVCMTGGVAKNSGMFTALGDELGVKLNTVKDPQINGALGAALMAAEMAK